MKVNPEFWRGRRVFLTGHTGFKGSWLSLWLKTLGADVTGFALDPPTSPNLFEQAAVSACVRSVRGDIRDFAHLKNAIAESRPEVVLHLAAQSVVRTSYEDPIETYSANVMGTVHVFEAIRQLKLRCAVVNVTSDKCYENRNWIWGYRENEPMGGHDPYSNSKGCAELVTSSYRDSFFSPEKFSDHGVALASVRAGNVVGGGDWTRDQLIPDLMRAFLETKPCLIRNPLAYRPWQFVLEPLRGYLGVAERLALEGTRFASGWNFGPVDTDVRPVSWIADELVKLWGDGASWELDAGAHPHEDQALRLDATKAAAGLGWRPMLPLNQALTWIADWYKVFSRGGDLKELTLHQIQQYESLARN
jgi:CDP-glucose 4,6-dehydratase